MLGDVYINIAAKYGVNYEMNFQFFKAQTVHSYGLKFLYCLVFTLIYSFVTYGIEIRGH